MVFSCWLLSWKSGAKLGKLSVIDQVLTIGVECTEGVVWFPELVAAECRSESYFSVWSGHLPVVCSAFSRRSGMVVVVNKAILKQKWLHNWLGGAKAVTTKSVC